MPVVYDNLLHGHAWAVKWGPLERGDIRDGSRLADVLATYKPAAVLHFAGLAYVGQSVVDPGRYYEFNVAGSLTLVQAMRELAGPMSRWCGENPTGMPGRFRRVTTDAPIR